MATKSKKRKRKPVSNVQNASALTPLERLLQEASVLSQSSSGETVTARDMLGYPPAWACINKISGNVGVLPLNLYQRDATNDRKKKLAEMLPAYWLMKHQPNPIMTPLIFRQTVQGHALWAGNGRAYIKRNMRGEPSEVWPLPPDRCSTVLVTTDGDDAESDDVIEGKLVSKWHLLRNDEGQIIPIPDRNILHIPGLGYDGLQGYPVLDLAREWLGLSKAQNKAVGGNFKNGARPGIMLKAPPGAFKTQEDARAFLSKFRAEQSGADNEGKVGLLSNGVEAQVLQISARDSQWQESRTFSRQDAAIWFQVEQMLGDDSSVSYRSLEEKNRAFVANCLMRWLTTWEQECWAKLLTQQQRESMLFYFRFVTAALLRGTALDRYQVYQLGRQMRVLSANDVREMEDMDPIEGGDEYENPAIDTQAASSDSPPKQGTSDTPATQDNVRARLRSMVASRLGEIQQVEANRAKQAAENAANFCQWVDNFYEATQFTARIETTWQIVGLSAASAADYATESKRQLLDAAGRCTQETLATEVGKIVATWPERINQLAAIAAGA